jgi:hypothetical protein
VVRSSICSFVPLTNLTGATCSLIALPLRQIYGEKVTAVCFGSPRVGNAAFSDFFARYWTPGSYFRVTSANDGVPQQPAAALGFKHAGNEYWIKKEPPMSPADIAVCNGSEDPACNGQFKTGALFGINKAHLTYIVSFLTPKCGTAADLLKGIAPVAPAGQTIAGPPAPALPAIPLVGGPAVDVPAGPPIQAAVPVAAGNTQGGMPGMPMV